MRSFTTLTSLGIPLIRDNIDTDAIIPSREMTAVSKTGLADGLFAGWRYRTIGSRDPDPDFVINQPRYKDATILLGGENFGCGSSREHAAWALAEFGIRAVIARSFNPIFRGNCVRNGIAPIQHDPQPFADSAEPVTINLPLQRLSLQSGAIWSFEIDREAKTMLLNGLDSIDLTLKNKSEIESFRASDRKVRPWVYL